MSNSNSADRPKGYEDKAFVEIRTRKHQTLKSKAMIAHNDGSKLTLADGSVWWLKGGRYENTLGHYLVPEGCQAPPPIRLLPTTPKITERPADRKYEALKKALRRVAQSIKRHRKPRAVKVSNRIWLPSVGFYIGPSEAKVLTYLYDLQSPVTAAELGKNLYSTVTGHNPVGPNASIRCREWARHLLGRLKTKFLVEFDEAYRYTVTKLGSRAAEDLLKEDS